MRRFGIAAVVGGLLAASAAGQDAVEIKIAYPKAGDRFKVTETEKTKNVEVVEAGGKKSVKDEDETRDIAFTDEIVTAGANTDKPVKLVRTYEKYELKGGKEKGGPPLNTPITIAKVDGKYTYTAAGKPLGDFAKTLDHDFNKANDGPATRDMMPGKPVKPGDTWTIDPAKFVKSLADTAAVETAKSSMTGKLVKTYKKDGKLFGVIEVQVAMPIKDLGKDAPPLKAGVMKVTSTIDVCIDGTDPAERTKSAVHFGIQIDTKELRMDMKADGVLTSSKELLPKR